MKKFDLYWCSNPAWFHFDEYLNQIVNDDAPEEAKKSFAHFVQQLEEEEKSGLIY